MARERQRDYLLVDGYNVVHAWPRMQKLMARNPDAAAARLVETLRVLHDDMLEVTVVFDGRGSRVERSATHNPGELCVLYSAAGSSADAVIEQIVCRAPKADLFTVASRDNMVRETVSALGARAITPEDLADWVDRRERQLARAVAAHNQKQARDFGNRLF